MFLQDSFSENSWTLRIHHVLLNLMGLNHYASNHETDKFKILKVETANKEVRYVLLSM